VSPKERILETRGPIFKRTNRNIPEPESALIEFEGKTGFLKQQIAERDEKIQQIHELFEQLAEIVSKMRAEADTERYQTMVKEHDEKLAQLEAKLEGMTALQETPEVEELKARMEAFRTPGRKEMEDIEETDPVDPMKELHPVGEEEGEDIEEAALVGMKDVVVMEDFDSIEKTVKNSLQHLAAKYEELGAISEEGNQMAKQAEEIEARLEELHGRWTKEIEDTEALAALSTEDYGSAKKNLDRLSAKYKGLGVIFEEMTRTATWAKGIKDRMEKSHALWDEKKMDIETQATVLKIMLGIVSNDYRHDFKKLPLFSKRE